MIFISFFFFKFLPQINTRFKYSVRGSPGIVPIPSDHGHLAHFDQYLELGFAEPTVEQKCRLDIALFDHQCLLDVPRSARFLRWQSVLGKTGQGDPNPGADHRPGEEVAAHDQALAGVYE